MITKKIFNYNDSAVLIIGRLVELHFSGQIEKKITDNISLNLPTPTSNNSFLNYKKESATG